MKFTDAQKFACDISRNIAVTAGAGSGKTSVLVERYLWCLQNNGYQVRRIAAITFTEKAAGEMLARIRHGVIQRLSSEIGDPQRWEDVLEQLPLAQISTIHGFCQRLLREFPIEAGIDPNFDVFDEAIKHILLNRLCGDLIQQRAESDDPHIRLLAQYWSQAALRKILIDLLECREKSLPWAEGIAATHFPTYVTRLHHFVADLQRFGIQHLVSDGQWKKQIKKIQTLIPPGDTSKLTSRCLNILEFDAEFRQQSDPAQQFTTLAMLKKELRMITPNKIWKEENRNGHLKKSFDRLKALYSRYVPDYTINDDLERSGFLVQQSLAHLFLEAYRLYRQEKTVRQQLDFDDLQERALHLLQQPDMQRLLAGRHDFIMVDEFQDTNQLQWDIIRKFGEDARGLHQNRFCVVGDEKQSIYMFRGADVAVFGDVRQALKQTNADRGLRDMPLNIPEFGDLPDIHEHQKDGEIVMAENFRSTGPLIAFLNALFSHLFLEDLDETRPYDVTHQQLIAGRKATSEERADELNIPGEDELFPVEFLFNGTPPESPDTNSAAMNEPERIALRILELIEGNAAKPEENKEQKDEIASEEESEKPLRYQDIAILLRTRTRLKEFEVALRRHQIPFIVAGGIGFYEQQEIYDLANLLRFLVDNRQDIALAGVLRSPLFGVSDDQLWYAATGIRTESKESAHSFKLETLWEKLQRHVKSIELIPDELEPRVFLRACTQLKTWTTICHRIPITHLLRRIIEESGLYGILASDVRTTQAIENVEKLLDIARKFENEGFQSLQDFVPYLDQLMEIGEREGEAQIHAEGMNVVQLMTIHASKGLEFPVVFVPELERPFNYGSGESVYFDAIPAPYRYEDMPAVVAGVKGSNPEQNYAPADTLFRGFLRRLNAEKTDAEMKRLLYVACTRAKSHLILSGTISGKIPKQSWLSWLKEIFSLETMLAQGQELITLPTSGDEEEQKPLQIKIRTALVQRHPWQQETGKNTGVPQNRCHFCRQKAGQNVGDPNQLSEILRQNLQPIKGHENTVYSLNPSTLHVLFQCPRRFYFQHVLDMNEKLLWQLLPHLKEDTRQEPSFGSIRGNVIHKLFEKRFFDTIYGTEGEEARLQHILKEFDI
ncbi:hypothetical protein CSA56_07360, partial [candidate division KSB3 bacterium]